MAFVASVFLPGSGIRENSGRRQKVEMPERLCQNTPRLAAKGSDSTQMKHGSDVTNEGRQDWEH
jgi:hypothetical protein